MDEEEKVKRITSFLEKGCTMLANHHDCGAPLFRCKGKILCPICSFSTEKPDNTSIGETDGAVPQDADETKTSRIRAGGEGALSSSVEPPQASNQEHREKSYYA